MRLVQDVTMASLLRVQWNLQIKAGIDGGGGGGGTGNSPQSTHLTHPTLTFELADWKIKRVKDVQAWRRHQLAVSPANLLLHSPLDL